MGSRLRMVLAALGSIALVGCGGAAAPPIVSSAASSGASASAVSTSAAATPAGSTQDSIPVKPMADLTAFASGQVGDIIAGGPGFLVVGYIARPDNGVDGAVWTSADGLAWIKGPGQKSFADRLLTDVVAIPGGFAAGGQECASTGGGECGRLNVWNSPDGTAWTPATFEVARDVDCCNLEGLAARGPGMVGVGSDLSDVSSGPKDAISLTSADGRSWAVHRGDPTLVDAETTSVVSGGPGLIAVGGRASGAFAAWSSADGTTWTSAAPLAGVTTGAARDVIVGGPGFVAVGKDGADAAVWTSADGAKWARLPASEGLKGGLMNRVILVGGTIVAVGKAGLGAALWTSPDGVTWTRLPDQDSFSGTEMTSVAAAGKTVVIFGKRPSGTLPAWTASLP